MYDLIALDHKTQAVITKQENIKLDEAIRAIAIILSHVVNQGKEIDFAVRPHDPRRHT